MATNYQPSPLGQPLRWQGIRSAVELFVELFSQRQTGFEYQVASHMIYEGEPGSEAVMHGLAVARAVHDRYAPAKRNPYNEIECGDRYSRAMAVYGVYLAVCGYKYDGPAGKLGFGPRISPEDFQLEALRARGAEGVVLGCTDLPMIINQSDLTMPVFDTVQLHSRMAVDFILGRGQSAAVPK